MSKEAAARLGGKTRLSMLSVDGLSGDNQRRGDGENASLPGDRAKTLAFKAATEM